MKEADIIKMAGLFIEDGKVLLTRDYGSEVWTTPGGTIEDGESKEDCLVREIKEELKAEIKILKFYKDAPAFPAANDPGKTVKIYFYLCEFTTIPEANEEIEELKWFSKDDFDSGKINLSHAGKDFLFPELIKDKVLT